MYNVPNHFILLTVLCNYIIWGTEIDVRMTLNPNVLVLVLNPDVLVVDCKCS